MKRHFAWVLGLALSAAVFVATSAVGSVAYFHFADPQRTCSSCHEMTAEHAAWSASAHRTLHCRNCHGGALTSDVHVVEAHLRRVVQHFKRTEAKPIRLNERAALALHSACRSCHPQSFADWTGSRHAANYDRIFLNPEHNRTDPPAADCLRCHGMFFDGHIDDLVQRTGANGDWALKEAGQGALPTIPCLACHRVHTRADAPPAHVQFYDRRERNHLAAAQLPAPKLRDGTKPVQASPDPRQRVCAQCHAPAANHELGSADDRTLAGVHAGLSCLDCHQPHSNSARASCATCHPADSNCGLEVEKMDTSFRSETSRHNIHRVGCGDCHQSRRPEART